MAHLHIHHTMHLSHTLIKHRPQAVFSFGAHALRQPHIARHWRVPSIFGPRKRLSVQVRALHVRNHSLYLKFLH